MNNSKKAIGIFTVTLVMAVFLAICVPASAPAPPAPIDSCWSTVAPSIDGNFTDGEWENSQLLIPDPIHTYVYFMNDNEYLYICVDAASAPSGDYTDDPDDSCALYFDTDQHEIWTPDHEDIFTIWGSAEKGHAVANETPCKWDYHCNFSAHPGLEGAVGFNTSPNAPSDEHRIYEFKIPLSLLMASPGDTLGFASPEDSIPCDVNTTVRDNYWPPDADLCDFTTWGDLILASPPPVPTLTPIGLIALVSALSAIAAVAIVRKRR
jgi:hypothetical protein